MSKVALKFDRQREAWTQTDPTGRSGHPGITI